MGFGMGFCCCGVDCNYCCTGETMVVDFGAGGWTDASCTNCTAITGTFVLTYQSPGSCQWRYTNTNWCSFGITTVGLTIFINVDTDCKPTLTLSLYNVASPTVNDSYTNFLGDPGTPIAVDADCDGVYTMDVSSDEHSAGYCAGTLPASVTFENV